MREATTSAVRAPTTSDARVTRVSERIRDGGGEVDYVQAMEPESLTPYVGVLDSPCVIAVAAKFGSVRLLDNVEIMCGE